MWKRSLIKLCFVVDNKNERYFMASKLGTYSMLNKYMIKYYIKDNNHFVFLFTIFVKV